MIGMLPTNAATSTNGFLALVTIAARKLKRTSQTKRTTLKNDFWSRSIAE